jgi:hypothetical protein
MIIYEIDGPYNTELTGSVQPIIQNLGPGDIHIYNKPDNIVSEGLFIPVNGVYEFPTALVEGAGNLWIQVCIAGTSADVRIMNVG